jgi:hypothetical protein
VGLVFFEVAKRSAGLLALAFACAIVGRRLGWGSQLDTVLAVYLAAELLFMTFLCLGSTGAWVNYAMPPVVFTCVLVGRGLARALAHGNSEAIVGFFNLLPPCGGGLRWGVRGRSRGPVHATSSRQPPTLPSPARGEGIDAEPEHDFSDSPSPTRLRVAGPILIAALTLLVADTRLVAISARQRRDDSVAVQALLSDPTISRCAPKGLYFVGLPQHNRRYGRPQLAHDEWLYNLYEAAGAAEPRAQWLRSALTAGPIRIVVMPDARAVVPGLDEPLADLGYKRLAKHGSYFVWERPGIEPQDRRLARTEDSGAPTGR